MKWTIPSHAARARRYPGVLLGALTFAAAAAGGIAAPQPAVASTGTTYYVSSSTGSDQNSGTSESVPWKSLTKVDATTFQPGDTILFKAGDAWTGQLWPKGSGSSGAPVQINAYGTGAKPRIAGAGAVADAVKLWNQQYWEIRDLDVSNAAPATSTPGANLGDFRGIHVGGDNGKPLDHFVVDSVYVHDVTGEVNWIGGSTGDNKPGIHWKTGWDRSKNTGGIVFNTTVPDITAPPRTATAFHDVTIENSSVHNTSFGGIVLKQYTGDAPGAVSTGWGKRASATDPKFTPFTRVTIQNNYITQNGTAYGCDGIYLTDVQGGLVQNNLIDRVGTSGIELYTTDQVTVQHNETTGTVKKAGGADFNGIDTDIATTNSVVQYNYIHNNGDGYLACACQALGYGSAVFRYNVLASNSRTAILLSNSPGDTTKVYNNTVYNTGASSLVIGSGGTNTFNNNIFYTNVARAGMSTSSGVVYNNNLYGGNSPTVPSGDTNAVIGDPRLSNPSAGGTGTEATGPDLNAGLNWKIAANSPAANAGITLANNGGLDYAAATVPIVPDIGAFQHTGPSSVVFGDDFDALAPGALANGVDGWTVTSTGNQVNVAATPSPTDKSVQLVRTQNTGGTAGTNITRTFSSPLTGTVTVEADVMRNDSTGGYFGLPYLYDASGAQTVSVAFAHGDIEAYRGTTLQVIKPYKQGSWYHIKLVANTSTQHFDLYLNGRQVLTAAPFRTNASSISRMAFYANGGEYGSAYVDNVSVY